LSSTVPSARATATICNTRGLHARASAKFVKLASSFESDIRVIREGVTVNALSIMGLLMLGAGNGSAIDISAEGSDAVAAVDALGDLVARRFDEDS
jgi:phosphocarrier protein